MFSIYHFIWIGICLAIIAVSLLYINKKKITVKQLLPVCCAVSVISEIVKTFSVFKVVPSSDGSTFYPYFELQFLPLHMCSLLIFVIFYCTYGKNEKLRNILLGLLYPAGIFGGICAIMMPSIFTTSITPREAFLSPLAYQTFIYHAMLIVLGITIAHDKTSGLTSKNFKTTVATLSVFTFLSLYMNSLFAVPVYKSSHLQSVEYTTNFFFTYKPPVPIKITTVWQWYMYLAFIVVLAVILVFLCYLPFFIREKKTK